MKENLIDKLHEAEALDILKDTTIDYTNRKRRILYLLRKYNYTDDEPLVISK